MTVGCPQYIVPAMRNISEVLTPYSPSILESVITDQSKGSHSYLQLNYKMIFFPDKKKNIRKA